MKHTFFFVLIALLALPAAAQSMFADHRARSAGDVVTIVLAERTSASRASEWDNRASNSAGGSGTASGGNSLSGRFALDATFSKDAKSSNSSLQRDLLSGTMTAIIESTDPSGNLILSGRRSLTVNGETHLMEVSGLVRARDIQTNNSVYSYQIANADIVYKREGGLKRSFLKPGRLVRLGAVALLGGALVYTTN